MTVMITYGNKFFDVLNIEQSDKIDIFDIAHSLSNKCRFNGHCRKFYSVAEHSVWCSRLAPNELKLSALMHDASEAFLGDITGPLKSYWADVFTPIEEKIDEYIRQNFNLPILSDEDKKIIKRIDKSMLLHEAICLFDNPFSDSRFIWPNYEETDKIFKRILCLSPIEIEQLFLAEYKSLT